MTSCLATQEDQAVDALAAGAPGDQAPLHLSAVESCGRGELRANGGMV
jgi:hypothetical protein